MDAENVEIIIVDEEEDLGDQGEDTSIKSNTENEAVVDENEEENSDQMESSSESSEKDFEEETLVAPRTFISKTYLEATEWLTETNFSTHKRLSMPWNAQTKTGGFDAFFAATLHTDDGNDILIENGDCFNEFIFLVCLKAEKADDLLFVFINSAWLDKCPEESEGYEAMVGCTAGKWIILIVILIILLLSPLIVDCLLFSSNVRR